MLEQADITEAVRAYRETAETAAATAEQVQLPNPVRLRFCTLAITSEYAKNMSQLIPTGKREEDRGSEFIYVFVISDTSQAQAMAIADAFGEGRAMQAQRDYPGKKNLCQLNGVVGDSRAIYIGRSYSPRERFKQHLLESQGGMYAIHFQSWSTKIHLHVEFFCYQLRDLGDLAAQVLEDGLWDHLKPILGKRGAR